MVHGEAIEGSSIVDLLHYELYNKQHPWMRGAVSARINCHLNLPAFRARNYRPKERSAKKACRRHKKRGEQSGLLQSKSSCLFWWNQEARTTCETKNGGKFFRIIGRKYIVQGNQSASRLPQSAILVTSRRLSSEPGGNLKKQPNTMMENDTFYL